jgi:NAD(P)-dependent dehydrogenase (short-subunit alcohol dehydrogenase family)
MGRVQGKVALVSGAASGIGAACARMLAREGASVVLGDIAGERAMEVARELSEAGHACFAQHLDAADEASWIELVDATMRRFGRLNVAVNCAGVGAGPSTFPSDATLEHWRAVMSVNLDGVFLGTKHALAAMTRSDPVRGSIINISSVIGLVGKASMGAYGASKGGVRLYSKSVAVSCAEAGVDVRVNSVHPGFIDTPLLRAGMRRFQDQEEAQRIYDALAPVGHLGDVDDVAYGVLYLASDESKFVTGTELIIDGGYTAR